MNDIAEVMKLGLLLERKLSERGLVDQNGDLTSPFLPTDIEEKLDGLIGNPIELEGILRLANAARRGEALSAPVANATRLRIEEICNAFSNRMNFRKLPGSISGELFNVRSTRRPANVRRFAPACLAGLVLSPAHADERLNCSAAAKAVLTETPGQLLSVEDGLQNCTIVFLMHREGRRPQKMTVRVQIDLPRVDSPKPAEKVPSMHSIERTGGSPKP